MGRRTAALGAALIALALPCAALAAFPGTDPTESPRANTPNDPGFDRCEGDDPDTPAGGLRHLLRGAVRVVRLPPRLGAEGAGRGDPVRQLRAARPAGPRRQRRCRGSRLLADLGGPRGHRVEVLDRDPGRVGRDPRHRDPLAGAGAGGQGPPQQGRAAAAPARQRDELRQLRLQRRRRLQRHRLRRRPARVGERRRRHLGHGLERRRDPRRLRPDRHLLERNRRRRQRLRRRHRRLGLLRQRQRSLRRIELLQRRTATGPGAPWRRWPRPTTRPARRGCARSAS